MTLKRLLILPLLVSLVIFALFSSAVVDSFSDLTHNIDVTPGLLITVVVAIGLQLVGHVIRAKKTSLLFAQVKENSVRFQFRALSVGYLFNAILPFRIGELIRARIISDAMTISFGYAFILVVFERIIDAILLGIVGLVIITLFVEQGAGALTLYALTLIVLSVTVFAALIMLRRENRHILHAWYRLTAVLNEDLKNSYRFKMWSVIYGLQQTLRSSVIRRYVSWTAASWLFYGASLVLVVQYFLHDYSVSQKAAVSTAPYYGVAIPSGPAYLGSFSNVVDDFAGFLHPGSSTSVAFILTVWAVLVLPIAIIGIVLLFGKTRETLWQTRPRQTSRQSIEHKLYRQEDISDGMKHFLENYFKGNSLSKIVHQLELSDNFKLVRYFKGGSDAITILALQHGREVVKKIIPLEFKDRLKAQYDWLEARNGTPGIVRVLNEEDTGQYYAIDLEFDPDNEMFYEYIHHKPIVKSKHIMDKVWESLFTELYSNVKRRRAYPKDRDAYIEKHIFGCYDKASAIDAELVAAAEPETIIINGRVCRNLRQIMDDIKNHPQAWKDIATYAKSEEVHGDVIVDNLLVSSNTDDLLIIDPAPDGNIITGPVFDFGKNMQSLQYGYETLLRDEDRVVLHNGNEINFRDHSSEKYRELADYVRVELAARYLSEGERKSILFHAGALYIRRLKHQVHYTPANVLKFYAVGVLAFNDFLEQYEPLKKAARRTSTARPNRAKPQKKSPRL